MESVAISLDDIYIPARFRDTLDEAQVEEIANDIMETGQQVPIQVREGKGRYVLVKGYERLEAVRALGEPTVEALIVRAPRS